MKPYNNTQPKKIQIANMFNNIAPVYDKLCHLLSFNIDKKWRKKFVKIISKDSPKEILDIATGTGDVAILLAKSNTYANVQGVDISDEMMQVGLEKIKKNSLENSISLKNCSAENLCFEDNTFDAISISFGIRNFENIDKSLKECLRVLKPNKSLYIMEFSLPTNKLLGFFYKIYSKIVIPSIGKILSKDTSAYTYLPESIVQFHEKQELFLKMQKAGFSNCQLKALSFGIASIYIGTKKA